MEFDVAKLFDKITWNGARNILLIVVIIVIVGVVLYKELKEGSSHDVNISGHARINNSSIHNGDSYKPQSDSPPKKVVSHKK